MSDLLKVPEPRLLIPLHAWIDVLTALGLSKGILGALMASKNEVNWQGVAKAKDEISEILDRALSLARPAAESEEGKG